MFRELLIVGAGSFIGGSARYAISCIIRNSHGFPYGTFTVNLAGCFLIGFIYGLLARHMPGNSSILLFLTTGICGGFTTFSTFSRESIIMLQNGQHIHFILYVAGSITLGMAAVVAGNWIGKIL